MLIKIELSGFRNFKEFLMAFSYLLYPTFWSTPPLSKISGSAPDLEPYADGGVASCIIPVLTSSNNITQSVLIATIIHNKYSQDCNQHCTYNRLIVECYYYVTPTYQQCLTINVLCTQNSCFTEQRR